MKWRGLYRDRDRLSVRQAVGPVRSGGANVLNDRLGRMDTLLAVHLRQEVERIRSCGMDQDRRLGDRLSALWLPLAACVKAGGDDGDHDLVREEIVEAGTGDDVLLR